MNVILGYMARRILGVVAILMQWRDDRRAARRTMRRARRHAQARRFTPQAGGIYPRGCDTPANRHPGATAMSRLDEICRAAWPDCESALTHESWHLPIVVRVLTAALEVAEASPQLTDHWLRTACMQARTRTETP